MKTLLPILALLTLTACTTPQSVIKPQIVYVDKPIFTCPAPPIVPSVTLLTPTLVPSDRTDPGKVAQYYKADMVQLQSTIDAYQSVIDQYNKASASITALQPQINKLYNDNNTLLQNNKPAQ